MVNQMDNPFVGFILDGVHSNDYGIIRTNEGLLSKKLAPEIKDYTAEVPGKDGLLYYGSTYGKREFSISFAFDALTEEQLYQLKQALGTKKIHELVFAEEPHKIWSVKVANQAILKHLCFDDEERRIYKGEGEVKFVSLSPYARSVLQQVQVDFIVGTIMENPKGKENYGGSIILSEEGQKILETFLTNCSSQKLETAVYLEGLISLSSYFTGIEDEKNFIAIYNSGDAPTSFSMEFVTIGKSTATFWVDDVETKIEFDRSGTWIYDGYDQTLRLQGNAGIYNEKITVGSFKNFGPADSWTKIKFDSKGVSPNKIEYRLLYL